MKKLIINIAIMLSMIGTSSFAGEMHDFFLNDGTHFRAEIKKNFGDAYTLIQCDKRNINYVKSKDINKVKIYIKGKNIGVIDISDNEMVFRNFLWTDTIADISEKLKNLEMSRTLDHNGTGSSFGYNDEFMSTKIEKIETEMKLCKDSVIKYTTQPIHKFISRIVLYFSNYDHKVLVSIEINVKKKEIENVVASLIEKYGEGEVVDECRYLKKNGNDIKYKGYLKWTNGNTTLFASLQRKKIYYVNTDNLGMALSKCNNRTIKNNKEAQTKIEQSL